MTKLPVISLKDKRISKIKIAELLQYPKSEMYY